MKALSLLCLIAGLGFGVAGGWIQAKALLAQWLLEAAWSRSLADGQIHRPWPWADHWPVARLSFPGQGRSFIVLEGDQGHALAFAPGHQPQSGLGADERRIVISGHRDTHFRLLAELQPGDPVRLQTRLGEYRFTVEGAQVLDSREHRLALYPDRRLQLVTCWPFEALSSRGPMRYLVTAEPQINL